MPNLAQLFSKHDFRKVINLTDICVTDEETGWVLYDSRDDDDCVTEETE